MAQSMPSVFPSAKCLAVCDLFVQVAVFALWGNFKQALIDFKRNWFVDLVVIVWLMMDYNYLQVRSIGELVSGPIHDFLDFEVNDSIVHDP